MLTKSKSYGTTLHQLVRSTKTALNNVETTIVFTINGRFDNIFGLGSTATKLRRSLLEGRLTQSPLCAPVLCRECLQGYYCAIFVIEELLILLNNILIIGKFLQTFSKRTSHCVQIRLSTPSCRLRCWVRK